MTITTTQRNKAQWRLAIALIFIALGVMAFMYSESHSNSPTRFSVIDVTASQTKENNIDLLSRFQLSLSSTAYDAIDHGVPIDIVLSYAEPQKRFWGKQYKVLDTTVFKLSRHALSNNYQLRNLSTFQTHQFITVDEALKHIAVFQITSIENNTLDEVAVRVYLDIFNLPAQIRASAFFSGHWRHDSFWTTWNIS